MTKQQQQPKTRSPNEIPLIRVNSTMLPSTEMLVRALESINYRHAEATDPERARVSNADLFVL